MITTTYPQKLCAIVTHINHNVEEGISDSGTFPANYIFIVHATDNSWHRRNGPFTSGKNVHVASRSPMTDIY